MSFFRNSCGSFFVVLLKFSLTIVEPTSNVCRVCTLKRAFILRYVRISFKLSPVAVSCKDYFEFRDSVFTGHQAQNLDTTAWKREGGVYLIILLDR